MTNNPGEMAKTKSNKQKPRRGNTHTHKRNKNRAK